jgi:small subunit ribosomal protein S20
MPITKGAAKTHRADQNKRVFNVRRFSAMKKVIKDITTAASKGETKKAEEMVPKAYKAIDKAEKRGLIKKNTAARKKSRLVALIKRGK